MKSVIWKSVLAALMIIVSLPEAAAQKDVLVQAQNAYQIGDFPKVIDLLDPYLNTDASSEEKNKARRLLVLANIYLDYLERADDRMGDLLRNHPTYDTGMYDPDPIEFRKLYETYRVHPFITVGVKFSALMTGVRPLTTFGVDDNNGRTFEGQYTTIFSTEYGLLGEFNINKRIAFGMDILLTDKRFRYEIPEAYDLDDVSYREVLSYISVPVLAKYRLMTGRFKPYVEAGAGVQFLTQAGYEVDAYNTLQGKRDGPFKNDNMQRRNSIDYQLLVGAGLMYRINKWHIRLGCRYGYGLTNVVKSDTRFQERELITNYYYVDDDFMLSNVYVSAGLSYSFYIARKRNVIIDAELPKTR